MAMKTVYTDNGGRDVSAEAMPAPVASDTTPAPVKVNDPAKAFVKTSPPPVSLGK
jgi:hypothetical protein